MCRYITCPLAVAGFENFNTQCADQCKRHHREAKLPPEGLRVTNGGWRCAALLAVHSLLGGSCGCRIHVVPPRVACTLAARPPRDARHGLNLLPERASSSRRQMRGWSLARVSCASRHRGRVRHGNASRSSRSSRSARSSRSGSPNAGWRCSGGLRAIRSRQTSASVSRGVVV
jgi:hypothetical protein